MRKRDNTSKQPAPKGESASERIAASHKRTSDAIFRELVENGRRRAEAYRKTLGR